MGFLNELKLVALLESSTHQRHLHLHSSMFDRTELRRIEKQNEGLDEMTPVQQQIVKWVLSMETHHTRADRHVERCIPG